MDTKEKREHSEVVRRALSGAIESIGFRRTKTTFWVREAEFVSDFVHLHLFRSGPSFRVHFGIRAMNDSFEAAALNGPSSDLIREHRVLFGLIRRKYLLRFDKSLASQLACADQIARFVKEVGEPWFHLHRNAKDLAIGDKSPLNEAMRENLAKHLAGIPDPKNLALSRSILGLTNIAKC